MGGNGNRDDGKKWEWECSVGLVMGGNGNGNDAMGVGREWEQESHSRTPLLSTQANRYKTEVQRDLCI